MTFTEADLFASRRPAAPSRTDADAFLSILKGCTEPGRAWMTGKYLCRLLDWPDTESSRRKLRRIAELNRDKVCSSDNGYALLVNLTVKEAAHSWRRNMAMGRRLIEGAIRTRRSFYGQERIP